MNWGTIYTTILLCKESCQRGPRRPRSAHAILPIPPPSVSSYNLRLRCNQPLTKSVRWFRLVVGRAPSISGFETAHPVNLQTAPNSCTALEIAEIPLSFILRKGGFMTNYMDVIPFERQRSLCQPRRLVNGRRTSSDNGDEDSLQSRRDVPRGGGSRRLEFIIRAPLRPLSQSLKMVLALVLGSGPCCCRRSRGIHASRQ